VGELAVAALVVGLLGGAHCAAMCGGIVGALNLRSQRPALVAAGAGLVEAGGVVAQLPLHIAYSTGRVGSYAAAGAVAGAVGGTAALVEAVLPAQIALAFLANALVVLLGLYLAGVGRIVGRIEAIGAAFWPRVAPLGRRFLPADSAGRALGAGVVWGWLPCGLVYSALALALVSGDAARGTLVMLAFGLGTTPNLLIAGLAMHRLRKHLAQPRVRIGAGLAVAALGVWGAIRTPGLVEQVKQGLACLA
jgi:sulfite exporter TauE/SafE